ncbi:MAG: BrnT family toxin [Candidatus Deferrimicrobium sp.]
MNIEFDEAKSRRNARERGLPFDRPAEFEWETAIIMKDTRRDHGEPRFRAMGMIGEKLHALVFTPRHGGIRVISLRRANRREEKKYAETSEP